MGAECVRGRAEKCIAKEGGIFSDYVILGSFKKLVKKLLSNVSLKMSGD